MTWLLTFYLDIITCFYYYNSVLLTFAVCWYIDYTWYGLNLGHLCYWNSKAVGVTLQESTTCLTAYQKNGWWRILLKETQKERTLRSLKKNFHLLKMEVFISLNTEWLGYEQSGWRRVWPAMLPWIIKLQQLARSRTVFRLLKDKLSCMWDTPRRAPRPPFHFSS